MKTYGGVASKLQAFLISVVDGMSFRLHWTGGWVSPEPVTVKFDGRL
jgi:hypothetical protein